MAITKTNGIFDLARNVMSSLALTGTIDNGTTTVTFSRGYEYDTEKGGYYYISIEISSDIRKLDSEQRKLIKEFCTLEVPDWAKDSAWKPLQGERIIQQGSDDNPEVRVLINLSGAFECHAVDVDEPVTETAKELADTYERMTPEEALAHMRARAEELRKPTRGTKWSCTPTVFED